MSRVLNYAPENAGIITPWGLKRPYPSADERLAINRAFDALVAELKTREGESGNVALWNMSGLTAAVPQAQQLSAQQVQQAVDRVLDDLRIGSVAGVVEVVDDTSGLQGAVLPAGAVPSGGTRGGRIYLFLNGLRGEAEAFATIFHELFHLGLSQRIGRAEYRAAMLPFLSDPLVRQYAKRWRESGDGQHRQSGPNKMPVNDWHALSVEEALADIAEDLNVHGKGIGTRPAAAWVRRSIAALAKSTEPVLAQASSSKEATLMCSNVVGLRVKGITVIWYHNLIRQKQPANTCDPSASRASATWTAAAARPARARTTT